MVLVRHRFGFLTTVVGLLLSSFLLQPWFILLAVFCGLVNQRQQQIIEFQNSRIGALVKKLGWKRVLLDDDQRSSRHGHEEGVNSSRNMTVSETVGAEFIAVGFQDSLSDNALALIIDAWPTLPVDVKDVNGKTG